MQSLAASPNTGVRVVNAAKGCNDVLLSQGSPAKRSPPHSSVSPSSSCEDASANIGFSADHYQEKVLMQSPIVSEAGTSTDSFELISPGRYQSVEDGVSRAQPPSPLLPTLENRGGGHGLTRSKWRVIREPLVTISSGGEKDYDRKSSSPSHCQQYVTEDSSKTNEPENRVAESQQRNSIKPGVLPCLNRLYNRGELYRGVKPVVSTLAISNFVFFYALQVTKRVLAPEVRSGQTSLGKPGANSKLRSLLSSSLAGVINVLVTNPLWVANLRIVQEGMPSTDAVNQNSCAKKEPSLIAVMQRIIQKEGIGQLWSGTWASLVLVTNPAIQFFVYEQLKLHLLSRRPRGEKLGRARLSSLSATEAFVLGAVAKGVATVVTYPIQLAQVLLRLQKNRKASGVEEKGGSCRTDYSGTLDCIIKLSKSGGLQKLFSGMSAKLLQTVLTAAFTFLTYEQIVSAVQKTYISLFFQK